MLPLLAGPIPLAFGSQERSCALNTMCRFLPACGRQDTGCCSHCQPAEGILPLQSILVRLNYTETAIDRPPHYSSGTVSTCPSYMRSGRAMPLICSRES